MNIQDEYKSRALIAGRMALQAGAILKTNFAGESRIEFKGATDLVTETDYASEAFLRNEIKKLFPGESFIGEESGGVDCYAERAWIADPLDGTTNFAHRLPHFDVSIAYCEKGEPLAGVVYQPMTDDLFYAWKGGGAWRNGKRIHVSKQNELIKALAVTGFPYNPHKYLDVILARLRSVIPQTQGLRRYGAAAMDLCYTAAGIFDIYWEITLKPWDVAAGFLILKEAGGKVTDFSGGEATLDGGEMLATNGLLHEKTLKMIQQL